MASKTVQEAIDNALYIGSLTDVKSRLLGYLRDYFAHKCQIFGHKNNCEEIMLKFFDETFGHISPFNGDIKK